MQVLKFGGSSLADAGQFRRVANIVKAEADRRYVVPSAPGKRFSADTKVTDMLYTCYNETLKSGEISLKIPESAVSGALPFSISWGTFLGKTTHLVWLKKGRKKITSVSFP